jgi:tripartite-type tricarboxylate transporter receptor subunit TctC
MEPQGSSRPVCRAVASGLVFAFLLALIAPVAGAASFPTKPITFVVPFPPGGRTDLTARLIAQVVERHLGAPVVVINKAGAGGVLGAKEVSQARPDGYVLGFFSTAVLTAQYTVPAPTDLKDYEIIGIVTHCPCPNIATRTDLPAFAAARDLCPPAAPTPIAMARRATPGFGWIVTSAPFDAV